MENQGEKLRYILKGMPYGMGNIAEMLNMTRQNLNHHLRKTVLDESFLRLLNDKLNIKFENDSFSLVKSPTMTPLNIDAAILLNVPLVQEYAYAGYMSGYTDENYLNDLPTIPFIADKQYKGTYMAFQIRGDSMDDGTVNSYLAGDIVLCREVSQAHWKSKLHIQKWDFIIVHRTEGILLKKITKHNPDTGDITAHSLNPLYDDIEINLADVAQLFNVVKVERKK